LLTEKETENGTEIHLFITDRDIAKAVAEGLDSLEGVMTEDVHTVSPDEPIGNVTQKMKKHNISALPVTNSEGKILGIVTSDIISQLVGRERPVPGSSSWKL